MTSQATPSCLPLRPELCQPFLIARDRPIIRSCILPSLRYLSRMARMRTTPVAASHGSSFGGGILLIGAQHHLGVAAPHVVGPAAGRLAVGSSQISLQLPPLRVGGSSGVVALPPYPLQARLQARAASRHPALFVSSRAAIHARRCSMGGAKRTLALELTWTPVAQFKAPDANGSEETGASLRFVPLHLQVLALLLTVV